MPLTEAQLRLAVSIDRHVTQTLASVEGGEALLVSMYDHMGSFKQLLDTCSPEDMDILCEQYEGFHRVNIRATHPPKLTAADRVLIKLGL